MADEGKKKDYRGTVWDWPLRVAVVGFLLMVFAASNGAGGGTLLGLLLGLFGLVTWLARRGTFSPRRPS